MKGNCLLAIRVLNLKRNFHCDDTRWFITFIFANCSSNLRRLTRGKIIDCFLLEQAPRQENASSMHRYHQKIISRKHHHRNQPYRKSASQRNQVQRKPANYAALLPAKVQVRWESNPLLLRDKKTDSSKLQSDTFSVCK